MAAGGQSYLADLFFSAGVVLDGGVNHPDFRCAGGTDDLKLSEA